MIDVPRALYDAVLRTLNQKAVVKSTLLEISHQPSLVKEAGRAVGQIVTSYTTLILTRKCLLETWCMRLIAQQR